MEQVLRKLTQSGNFHPDYALFVECIRHSNHAAGSRFKIDNMTKFVSKLDTFWKTKTPDQQQAIIEVAEMVADHFGILANPIAKQAQEWKKKIKDIKTPVVK